MNKPVLVSISILLTSGHGFAHGGVAAEARITSPAEVGAIADEAFTITWIDLDRSIPTGTATVNLFFTERMPPTFFRGEIPPLLEGTPIVMGIREPDLDNRFDWDLLSVPSGTYWIWSRVDEPPEPTPSPQVIRFSDAPLSVKHSGDPIGPAVRLLTPPNAFAAADESYEIRYRAFDPNGGATVRLEAGRSLDGTGFATIASGLPGFGDGAFLWETEALDEGDWTLRAITTDGVGTSTAYSPFFLLITHFEPGDASVAADASTTIDASILDAAPGAEERLSPEGCGCSSTSTVLPGMLMIPFWRRRGR